MIVIIPKVPVEYDKTAMKKLMDIISEPTRARIYFETLLCRNVSARYLMERMTVSRSALSHHLSILVKEGILNFHIETEERPHKVYYLTKDFETPIVESDEDKTDDWLFHRLKEFESIIIELQTFVSIATNNLKRIKKEITIRDKSGKEPEEFIDVLRKTHRIHAVHILTEDEANIWTKMYLKFLKEFESKLQLGGDHRYVSFSGILPLTIDEPETDPTF
ncbi:MAG: winged helix-turn-helix domain-containing protein [Candidatus Thorarchaeota archaeon]